MEGMDRKSVCVFCCIGFQGSTDSGQEVLQGSSRRRPCLPPGKCENKRRVEKDTAAGSMRLPGQHRLRNHQAVGRAEAHLQPCCISEMSIFIVVLTRSIMVVSKIKQNSRVSQNL